MKLARMGVALAIGLVLPQAHAQSEIRTDVIEYHDNLGQWVLGQTAKVTNVETGLVVSETQYNGNDLPWKTYSFGKLQQTLGYNADGTLATATDGRSLTTTLSNWKRGIPQSIQYADATGESAVVNDDGTIASVTDENGYKTCYDYDAMGRVTGITYPSESQPGVCDTSTWAKQTMWFGPVPSAEHGLAAGHWTMARRLGNQHVNTYYDALWRPVLEESLDYGDIGNTLSQTVKRYDAEGRLSFQSYPARGVASFLDAASGTRTYYDALGRTTRVEQDSELGVLTATSVYETGFKTRVTNPRNQSTTTSYKAYDQPATDWPVAIIHPEGAFTDIARDVFGKPTSLVRHNADSSQRVTRSYVYNAHQLLCRIQEPETAVTFMDYDPAGNLAWSAAGYVNTSVTGCADSSWVGARRVDRSYDARNRVKTLSFPDGLGNTTYDYEPDGQLKSLMADNGSTNQVTTSYAYNRRRLLTKESMVWGSINWPIDYTYNANGHLASQTWHGMTVGYAPNALGQPTQAGTYATGVSYFPNGAMKQFTYGNGIVHTLTQNSRGLPDTSKDAYGTTSFLNDGYDYDANGNVGAITDGATGTSQRGNRTMTYDGLDRLKTTTSAMYGATGANYTYDVLDNLTQVNVGGAAARNHYYCYDTAWRLTNVKTGSCTGTSVIGLGYDVQGNLNNKNGVTYTFDYGNRLRSVISTPASSYVYDGHGRRVRDYVGGSKYSQYSQSGQLMQTSDGRTNLFSEYIYLNGSLVALRERDTVNNIYTTKYQHTDALGSPVVVTDANRVVLERNEYEPFGKVIAPASPKDGPGYTGHVLDAATGMNYMQQRYYDPGIGRFLSVDPVTANSGTGANFNRYWYANNNPYKFTDPDGRRSVVDGDRIKVQPEDKTVPAVNLPNNVGAKGVGASDKNFHTYQAATISKLTPSQAGEGIKNNPTPGNDKPASPTGTKNDAGYLPVLPGSNMVMSYSIPSPDTSKYTDITVNYTISGEHKLSEGFVIRFGEIRGDGSVLLRSYGEGNSWRQGGMMESVSKPAAENAWQENHQEIINSAR